MLFAPRMWRCFQLVAFGYSLSVVCSTHVEMFLTSGPCADATGCLLHACGDVSGQVKEMDEPFVFAPRMWRCFW